MDWRATLHSAARLLADKRVAVLTGAGISTESGIPDYRGPETRRRARNPIQYRAFVDESSARERYWARSFVGWPRFRLARPNLGHGALARLEQSGRLTGVITQNVDGLHQEAGSRRVVELHGSLAWVRCLWCGEREPRDAFQERLATANPHLERSLVAELAPDGDAEIEPERALDVPGCRVCGGVMKPHVVFFGESCERPVVEAAFAIAEEADALLVVGSSLAVFSGYRFPLKASKRGQPIVYVNLGEPHRGLELADIWVDGPAGEALDALASALDTA